MYAEALVAYYLIYIITVVVSRYIYMRTRNNESNDPDELDFSSTKSTDIEHDVRSIRSSKSVQHDGLSSRKNSILSHISNISMHSQRKKLYSYEDGIVLTRKM